MLQAMNTGHDGSMTTLHSNSPRDTLARLETMVLMAGFDLPHRAIREQIASAVDLIVHQERMFDGSAARSPASPRCRAWRARSSSCRTSSRFEQTGDRGGRVAGPPGPGRHPPEVPREAGARRRPPAAVDSSRRAVISVGPRPRADRNERAGPATRRAACWPSWLSPRPRACAGSAVVWRPAWTAFVGVEQPRPRPVRAGTRAGAAALGTRSCVG